MKIAIFHNYLDNVGGAEIVCLQLARGLNADIYTTNINESKIIKMGFKDVFPRIKSIGKIPIEAPYRQQLAFMKFRKLNLKDKYDFFIIVGDWAISGAVNNKPNLEYFHSPLNEIWAFRNYVRKSLKFWMKPIYQVWTTYIRVLYKIYFKDVQIKICNSKNTQNRIKKYLKSDAKVIFPPVDCDNYPSFNNKNYWLSVNRLTSHKRVELQMKAFTLMPDKKLIIIGSSEKAKGFIDYKNYLYSIKPKNVQIINFDEINNKKLKKFYSNCRGFITTAKDEDFGMTPVEAMAAGKPVVAGNEGGYKETVINGKTGILIDDIDEKKLAKAINQIDYELNKNPSKYKNDCINQARKFSVNNFIKQIKKEIKI
jgi:glycosyltransferase involved in cell wall biosynthesis